MGGNESKSSTKYANSHNHSPSHSNTPLSCRERAKAAIIGGFVADAATMGLHLIYDQAAIENLVKERIRINQDTEGPEFFDPPASAFYDYSTGRQSPYGDEIMPLLQSVSQKGYFDSNDAIAEWLIFYEVYRGRLNRVSQRFLELKNRGVSIDQCAQLDDTNFESAAKIPIIVARYAGSPMLMEKVDDAVRIHQTNEKVLHATRLAAKLLEKVILGSTVPEALEWATTSDQVSSEEREYLCNNEDKGTSNGNLPFSIAVETFGLSGQLPGSLKSSIYALKSFRCYEVAIRANIIAGGDNACRSWIVGSLLAAESGEKAIPEQWKSKTLLYSQICSLANRIAGSNSYYEISVEKSCKIPFL